MCIFTFRERLTFPASACLCHAVWCILCLVWFFRLQRTQLSTEYSRAASHQVIWTKKNLTLDNGYWNLRPSHWSKYVIYFGICAFLNFDIICIVIAIAHFSTLSGYIINVVGMWPVFAMDRIKAGFFSCRIWHSGGIRI